MRSLVLSFCMVGAIWSCASGTTIGNEQPGTSAGGRGGVGATASAGGERGCVSALVCADDSPIDVICPDDGATVERCGPGDRCSWGACVDACLWADRHGAFSGCDFLFTPPNLLTIGVGECFAATVVNTSSVPTKLELAFGGEDLDVRDFAYTPRWHEDTLAYVPLADGILAPGELVLLFLHEYRDPSNELYTDRSQPCPVPAAISDRDVVARTTGFSEAFRVSSSAPTSISVIFPYGGVRLARTTSSVLYPVASWDSAYSTRSPYADVPYISGPGAIEHPAKALRFVAREDNTEVTFTPTNLVVGGGGIASSDGSSPIELSLSRGQVANIVQGLGLTGSVVEASKPIGVVTEDIGIAVPSGVRARDASIGMLAPRRALGHLYAAVRHRDRYVGHVDVAHWRVVGGVDGTKLTYFPSKPTGAPSSLSSGELVDFEASEPFVVSSQGEGYPFTLLEYMTGCRSVSPTPEGDCRGDPEMVTLVPSTRFGDEYTFFTDPAYPETHLVVVRTRGLDGEFHSVTVDCVGDLDGWKPLDQHHEYTRVDLVTGDYSPVGNCRSGTQHAVSQAPFGVTAWGWGSAATGGDYQDPLVPGTPTEAVSYGYAVAAPSFPAAGSRPPE